MQLYRDDEFRNEMTQLFKGAPSGRATIPTLQDALNKIEMLERRIAELEKAKQEAQS